MIHINIKLDDGTMISVSLEQARELYEKLGQLFKQESYQPAPWHVPYVQPAIAPGTTPATPYITWATTGSADAQYILNPCSDALGRLSQEM